MTQFRPNDDTTTNSMGQVLVNIDGKNQWVHLPRNCDACGGLNTAVYGNNGSWYCTNCWLLFTTDERI